MKINRFVALAAIALLVVGAMGVVSYRAFAQDGQPPVTQDCGPEVDDNEVAETGLDADTVEDQCGEQAGEQVEDGRPENAEAPEAKETADSSEAAALQGKATISAADAKAAALAANPGASVVNTELDEEQGVVVYNVELDDGSDVMVDAADGTILATETADAGGK